MSLKTYQARSMSEALQRVKDDLGRDAVILNTRSFKRGGVLGWGAQRMVEITASHTDQVAELAVAPAEKPVSERARTPEITSRAADVGMIASLRDDMASMRQSIEAVLRETRAGRHSAVPTELVETYSRLIAGQVADDLARELLSELRPGAGDASAVRQALMDRIAAMVPTSGSLARREDGRSYVVALVGPTGMGKTTTLAKLAANARLRDQRRVGMITIDNYRIAAVEQLRTYASILEIPLRSVSNVEEMRAALEDLSACDLILIDSAGRSPNDEPRLEELGALLDAAGADEVHLVLSSTHSEAAAVRAVEQFRRLGADRVVYTKLDEAVGFGVVLNVLRKVGLRVSYVTNGQSVPNDICVADSRKLAELIVGAEPAAGVC